MRPSVVVCVSRFFQRFVFAISVVIFAALGLGYVQGEFGWFGVHAGDEQDAAYRQIASTPRFCARFRTTTSPSPTFPK